MQKITVRFILILLFLSVYSKTYAASCTSVTATALTFAPMTSGSGTQALPVTITYTCTGAVTIGISSGTPYSSGNRQLFIGGTGTAIPYTLKDSATNLWGDGINGILGTVFSTSGSGSQIATFTVTVPSGVPSGIYTNSLDIKVFDGATTTVLTSTTLNPTLTIVDSCTISSNPTPIHFGTVAAGASASNIPSQSSTIGITCGNTVPYYWGADKGSGTNWNGSTRRMKASGSNTYIAYELKEGGNPLGDADLPSPYIPTIPSIGGRTDTANGTQKTYTINATVTENPLPSVADAYSDTVSYYVVW